VQRRNHTVFPSENQRRMLPGITIVRLGLVEPLVLVAAPVELKWL